MDLTAAQRWAGSAVLFMVGMIGSLGLGIVSLVVDNEGRHGSAVGLWVMSAIVGLATVVAVRLINARSWLSPWLVVGLVVPACFAAPLW